MHKILHSLAFFLLLGLSSFSQAAVQYIPDKELLNINCSDGGVGENTYICMESFTIKDHVWTFNLNKCVDGNCLYKGLIVYQSKNRDKLVSMYYNAMASSYQQAYTNTKNYRLDRCAMDDPNRPFHYRCFIKYDIYYNGFNQPATTSDAETNFVVYSISSPRECPNGGKYVAGRGCLVVDQHNQDGNIVYTDRNTGFTSKNCPTCLMDELSDEVKDLLPPPPDLLIGDPVSIMSQAVVETRTDITFPIAFSRKYTSKRPVQSDLGIGWKHDFYKKLVFNKIDDESLIVDSTNPPPEPTAPTQPIPQIVVSLNFIDETDQEIVFTKVGDSFELVFQDQIGYSVTKEEDFYILRTPFGDKEYYNLQGNLVKIFMRNGFEYNLTYTGDNLASITNQFGQSLTFLYNGSLISKITASNGDTVNYFYAGNVLTKATFNNVESIQYTYHASNNKLSSIIDELGNVYATFLYDTHGYPIQNARKVGTKNIEQFNYNFMQSLNYTSPNGFSSAITSDRKQSHNKLQSFSDGATSYNMQYDTNGNVSRYTDQKGYIYQYNYDSSNLLTSITKPDGQSVSISWNVENRQPSSVTEPSSNGSFTTTYSYDQYNNINNVSVSSSAEPISSTMTYTTGGRIVSSSNTGGNNVTYNYYADNHSNINLRGLLHSITNSLNQTVTFNSYDSRANPTSITGIDGITQTATYDLRGRVLTQTTNGMNITYQYDAAGNLKKTTLPNGYIVNMVYDQAHRLIQIYDNNSNKVDYVLDDNTSLVLNAQETKNSVLTSVKNKIYDNLGRVTSSWSDDPARAKKYSYKTTYLLSVTDENNNNLYRNEYMHYNDKPYDVVSEANRHDFTFDNAGNINSVKTSNSSVADITYDDLGQMTQLDSIDSGISNYTNSVADRTNSRIDAKGITHTTNTDLLGRITQIIHSDITQTLTENYSYKPNGSIASIVDKNSSVSWDYDNLGNLIAKHQTTTGITKNVAYGYNNLEQLSSMTYPSGLIVNYAYSKGNVVTVSTNHGALINNIEYQPFSSNATNWTWGNNSVMQKTYKLNDTLESIVSSNVMNTTISQDENGYILGLNDTISGINDNFTYDYYKIGNAFGYNYSGRYDGRGNLRYNPTKTFSYTNNRIDYIQDRNTGTIDTYGYDVNGNVLTDSVEKFGNNKYSYDLKNNLAGVTTTEATTTYTYNALNQRVSKTVNGVTTYFVYDEAYNLIGEYDASGSPISEHIYFNGQPIGLYKNGQIYYVHSDHLGTPRTVATSSGQIVHQWKQTDLWGSNAPQVSTVEYNLRFPGQYFDNETNLHYNIYRTYDPQTGRYLQPDPIGLASGETNLYTYVGHNTLSKSDKLGLYSDFISGSVDPFVMRLAANIDDEGHLVIIMHGTATQEAKFSNLWNINHTDGSYKLEKGSALYNMIDKNSNVFKSLNVHTDGISYGLTGKTLARLLKTIPNINYAKYKGISIYACNSSSSTNPKTKNLNAQDFADEMNLTTYGFDKYLMMTLKPNEKTGGQQAYISGYYGHSTLRLVFKDINDVKKEFKPR